MLKIILILLFLLFAILDIFAVCGTSIKQLLQTHKNKKVQHTSQITNSKIK